MDTLKSCGLSTASLAVMALVLPGVSALSDRIPVIASAAVALFMLLILIVAIVFASCYAHTWIRSNMKRNGKVKMPRSYFEKKKEAKRRLVAESVRSSRLTQDTYVPKMTKPAPFPAPMVNGGFSPPPPVMPAMDKETLVQGWQQDTRRVYEEKGYTLEMGDENEEEFQIETTLVDNEVLDVGPYKNLASSTNAKPVDGNVYSNPYIYSNNDRVTVTRSSEETGGMVSAGVPPPQGNGETPMAAEYISDKVIKL